MATAGRGEKADPRAWGLEKEVRDSLGLTSGHWGSVM